MHYALRTIISESRLLNDRLGNFERGSNSRIRIVCKAYLELLTGFPSEKNREY